jgi:hypothetical protein
LSFKVEPTQDWANASLFVVVMTCGVLSFSWSCLAGDHVLLDSQTAVCAAVCALVSQRASYAFCSLWAWDSFFVFFLSFVWHGGTLCMAQPISVFFPNPCRDTPWRYYTSPTELNEHSIRHASTLIKTLRYYLNNYSQGAGLGAMAHNPPDPHTFFLSCVCAVGDCLVRTPT